VGHRAQDIPRSDRGLEAGHNRRRDHTQHQDLVHNRYQAPGRIHRADQDRNQHRDQVHNRHRGLGHSRRRDGHNPDRRRNPSIRRGMSGKAATRREVDTPSGIA
jgi:hypothetical protein